MESVVETCTGTVQIYKMVQRDDRVPCPKSRPPESGKCHPSCLGLSGSSNSQVPEPKKDKKKKEDKKSKAGKNTKVRPAKSQQGEKTLCDIGKQTGVHCCAFCKALADYIREICKLICGVSNNLPKEEFRFKELFCELMDVTCALGRDCVGILKCLLKCFCDSQLKKKPSKRGRSK